VQSIEAAHHVAVSERADQPLANPVVFQNHQRRVFWLDFTSVGKLKTPGL
jgi:hypothetical protein